MESNTKNIDGALLNWAYWMTLLLCILSIPMCLFFLLLMGSWSGGFSGGPTFLQVVTPLCPAAVAWMTLDVLSRARSGKEMQHGIPYLIFVAGAAVLVIGIFIHAFLVSAQGSGLALICIVFAAVPSFAIFHILDAKRANSSD